MKILCKRCHKVLGEQEPVHDLSYVQAKCSDCILEEQAITFDVLKESIKLTDGSGIEVVLEDGSKGIIIAPVKGIENLGISEIIVAGRKINCPTTERVSFLTYLAGLPEGEVEVVYHFSRFIPMLPSRNGLNKELSEEEAVGSICRYCVAKVSKQMAVKLFDMTAEKSKALLDVVSNILAREWLRDNWMKHEVNISAKDMG